VKNILIIIILIFGYFEQISSEDSPSIGDLQIFPADNPWNWDITTYSVHPNSDNFIESIGKMTSLHPDFGSPWQGRPIGIPYAVVSNEEPTISITYTEYGDESDPGPFPIPLDAPIEGGPESHGDRHVITVDTSNAMLYELYLAYPKEDSWEAASGAKFDLSSNKLRPAGYTSADAAGLPIFPGLVRYEEVYIQKQINHAIRFTVSNTRREYIWPARHYASQSDSTDFPPMGLRFRLKADFDTTGFSEPVRVILQALKKHGMMVADNGSNWFISGAPDDRWNNEVLAGLKTITGSDFEAIVTVDENGNPIYPTQIYINNKTIVKEIKTTNYPNPFNPSTAIEYSIPKSSNIEISVFNLMGQRVATLINRSHTPGNYQVTWNGFDYTSGVYIYQIKADNFVQSKKMLLMK